jgi:hypothetical protein
VPGAGDAAGPVVPVPGAVRVAPGACGVVADTFRGAGGGITNRWNRNNTRNESVMARRTRRSI